MFAIFKTTCHTMKDSFRFCSLAIAAICVIFSILCSGCVTEEELSNTPKGNFDALWQIVDEHYCFFPDKATEYGLDWKACHAKYQNMLTPNMTKEQLFDVCGKLFLILKLDFSEFIKNFFVAEPTFKYANDECFDLL